VEGENLQKLVKAQAEIIKALETQIAGFKAQIAELQTIIARLQKDSRNSSKPPSSDIVKPKSAPQEKGTGKRKTGGQKGHRKHERIPFSPEQVDEFVEVRLQECPACGGRLNEDGEAVIKQQIDIVPKPFIVTEYHCHTYWCPTCRTYHTASEPERFRSGLFSVSLIAFAAYMKGRCHVSFGALKAFFQDILGIIVSRGFLAKQIRKTSGALQKAHEQLAQRLSREPHLYIDESGWKENGEKRWIWAFRTGKYAVFIIRGSRGAGVLEEVLGAGFDGVISCDFYGAYRKFQRTTGAVVQFCWAHLIREIRFLEEIGDRAVRRYGRRILKQVRLMFETIVRKGQMKRREWEL
jgi:transposase